VKKKEIKENASDFFFPWKKDFGILLYLRKVCETALSSLQKKEKEKLV